jgi:hypothetical protein
MERKGIPVSEKPEKKDDKPPKPQAGELHVDEGWKEEARREKERLAAGKEREGSPAEKEPEAAPHAREYQLPKPSFELMVTNFAIQALIAMGEIANPVTRLQERDLEAAKHAIDLLGVLEEKTRGNLTVDEKRHLDGTLYDLRMRYVSLMQG